MTEKLKNKFAGKGKLVVKVLIAMKVIKVGILIVGLLIAMW